MGCLRDAPKGPRLPQTGVEDTPEGLQPPQARARMSLGDQDQWREESVLGQGKSSEAARRGRTNEKRGGADKNCLPQNPQPPVLPVALPMALGWT